MKFSSLILVPLLSFLTPAAMADDSKDYKIESAETKVRGISDQELKAEYEKCNAALQSAKKLTTQTRSEYSELKKQVEDHDAQVAALNQKEVGPTTFLNLITERDSLKKDYIAKAVKLHEMQAAQAELEKKTDLYADLILKRHLPSLLNPQTVNQHVDPRLWTIETFAPTTEASHFTYMIVFGKPVASVVHPGVQTDMVGRDLTINLTDLERQAAAAVAVAESTKTQTR